MDPIQPDAESLLVNFLATHATLVPLHGGRVGTDLNAAGTYPAVRVTLISSARLQSWEWLCRLQVECWGTTREDSSTLARTLVAVVDDILGAHVDGEVRGWDAIPGFWAPGPDSEGARPRFLIPEIQLLIFPTYVPA